MNSLLKEQFARLGPVRAVDRVPSGSPAAVVLRLPRGQQAVQRVDAMLALVRRGMAMLRAKRAIEALLTEGSVTVDLPTLEDFKVLATELAGAGVAAARV